MDETIKNGIGLHRRIGESGSLFFRLGVIGGALALIAIPAAAGTDVQGQADQLELRTDNASIREALDALARAFRLSYRLPEDVSRTLNGRYAGTLHQVIGRILDGNNYIIKPLEDRLEVVVLGKSGPTGLAAPANAISAAVTPVAPALPASATTASPLRAPPPLPAPAVPTQSSAAPPPLASYLTGNGP